MIVSFIFQKEIKNFLEKEKKLLIQGRGKNYSVTDLAFSKSMISGINTMLGIFLRTTMGQSSHQKNGVSPTRANRHPSI